MDTAASSQEKPQFKISVKAPTALVAGGAGFLGSYLCEALIAQNFNVITVDDLAASSSKYNIQGLLPLPNFAFWEEDINKPTFKVSPKLPITYIFHLASIEEYLSDGEESLQTLLVNSLGTKNLLDLAVEREAKFVLVSSTDVFHAAASQVSLATYFQEEAREAQLSFSEAKRFAESLTAEYFKRHNLKTTIVRIKDPYGPRMNLEGGAGLARLIYQALSKQKIEVAGDGLTMYQPTYATDVIFGIIKAALSPDKGGIFTLVNPEKYTERTIAEKLAKIIGDGQITFKKEVEPDFGEYPLFGTATENKLGWSPKVSLDQGLADTVTYFRQASREPEKATTILLTGSEVRPKKSRGQRNYKWLRILVFWASTALIFWTVFLPALLILAHGSSGNRNLKAAVNALLADQSETASTQAKSAEESFKAASSATYSIAWLAKLLRASDKLDQTENYWFYAENLAVATKLSAAGVQEITNGVEANLDPTGIAEALTEARQQFDLAERSLQVATATAVNSDKLMPLFKKNLTELKNAEERLGQFLIGLEQAF